jgi:hypothetical protein
MFTQTPEGLRNDMWSDRRHTPFYCIAAPLLFGGFRVAASQQPLASLTRYCRRVLFLLSPTGQVLLELGPGLPVFIVPLVVVTWVLR